jgi:superfamily II DNA or RNA helicase
MSFEELLGKLSDRADLRGREFERICKWILRNAPEYRAQVRRAWLWDEWPGRWAADAGIDLVAETVAGDLWAIQAKAYDPAYTIKKADVDSFLSESARSEFSFRLLVATTDRIGRTARQTLAGQEKPAGVLLRSQLALAEIAWPSSPDDLRPRPPRRKRPRSHQEEAVSTIVEGFGSTDRGQLIMACGTGKTLVGLLAAEALGSKRTLVVVPSLSLLAQTLREWTTNTRRPFDYLAVCSDATVVGEDAVVSTTSELGFPVTTDAGVIASFLTRAGGNRARVLFSTYQSSPRLADAFALGAPAFDLLIADEAHRCAGLVSSEFATVLDAERIGARRRLFMTATPRYFTRRLRREASEADFEVASMDEEQRFGPVLHRLSFGEAIACDLLSDYQVVVVGVDDSTYGEYAERGLFVTRDGETVTDARTLASQLGLARAMAAHDLRRVVSFHSRIDSAREFGKSLPEVVNWMGEQRRPTGSLWAQHVSGEMSSGERDSRLNRLRETGAQERGLLSNARCLAEGVDVPTLDGVAFIDPRRSSIDVIQAVGRAIRKAEDKTIGTIVIPVFVDDAEDPGQALESSAFERVWQVVRALRDHDGALAEELDSLRRELGRHGTLGARPGKIVLDMPTRVGVDFAHAFDARLVQATSESWHYMFGLLMDFKEHAGHASPLPRQTHRDARLGWWCVHQRTLKRQGRLRLDREDLLRSIGFKFALRDTRFEDDCLLIERHVRDHGRLPRTEARSRQERRLASNIRLWRKQRTLGSLPDWKLHRLDQINGFYWSAFEESLAPVAAFIDEHQRRPNERTSATAHERRLASRLRQIEARQLSGSEAQLLGAALAGAPSPQRRDERWLEMAADLEHFVAGSRRLPKQGATDPDEARLATWINTQRHASSRASLGKNRVERLERIEGWFWQQDLDEKFRADADRVEAHVRRHGRLPGRGSVDPEEARLARWCSSRRMEANRTGKRQSPPKWKLERLRQIPGLLPPGT